MVKIDEDKLSRDCKLLQDQFVPKEKRIYQSFRRELLKNFDKPDYAILMIINVIAGEYIRYIRYMACSDQPHSAACVKSILNSLNELKLTPSSQEAADVSNTLSQLMNSITTKQLGGKTCQE